MPKGGGGKGKGKNQAPQSAGRVHRINYSNPQAAGLRILVAPNLFNGRRAYPELAYGREVVWYDPAQNSWVRHPEVGSMINQTGTGRTAIAHADYMWMERQMTLALWAYPTNVTGTKRMVVKALGGLNSQTEYDLRIVGGAVTFYTFSDSTSYSATGGSVSANNLYHFCGTVGTGGVMKVYINGVLVNVGDTLAGDMNNNASDFITGFATNNYLGYVGDVRLYNRGLSAAEVWQLYDPATRWDLYDFVGGYGGSGPGDLPLPPPPPPSNGNGGNGSGTDIQQRTGQPFFQI